MKTIVDTSVWVEFFQKKQRPNSKLSKQLWLMLEQGQIATLYPIKAEILSGTLTPHHRKTFQEAFAALDHLDLAWEKSESWQQVAELAIKARRKKLGIPGLVDRMILASAISTHAALWTEDKKLLALAEALGVPCIGLG